MSKLYAVALALLVLAVPAMAQSEVGDLASPYPQNLDVNISVEQIAELYHAGNADSLALSVFDAKHTFGRTLSMTMGGNCNFDVSLAVQAANNNIQDDVRFELVTNVDKAAWELAATDIGGGLWRFNNLQGDLAAFKSATSSYSWQISSGAGAAPGISGLPTSIARTPIWSYTDGATRAYTTIYNLFTVYAGHGIPADGDGDVLVEFYLSPTS